MEKELQELLEEWRDLCKKTKITVQEKDSSNLDIPYIKSEDLSKRKKLAQELTNNIDKLDINPTERFEIEKDAKK